MPDPDDTAVTDEPDAAATDAGDAAATAAAAADDTAADDTAGTGLGVEIEDTYDEPTDDVTGRTTRAGDDDAPVSVPDVMVLPEHPRDRPTVVLPRGPVPGQPHRQDHAAAAAADRGRTDRVRVGRGVPDPARLQAIEESTFWLPVEQATDDTAAEPAETAAPSRIGVPPSRRDRPRTPRSPFVGLLALLVVAFAATFFAWVTAEPLWLAAGRGVEGTATLTGCTGGGMTQRCEGTFTDGTITSSQVALLGVEAADRQPGTAVPARMLHLDSRQAFVGASGTMLHVRWAVGVLLVLGCGLLLAGATGARRLESARARRRAVLLSLAAPVALLAGFLAATY
jgi:hypothetical protein